MHKCYKHLLNKIVRAIQQSFVEIHLTNHNGMSITLSLLSDNNNALTLSPL